MEILKKYIAPWALINEDIPIHVEWISDKNHEIEIILPENFGFSKFFNVVDIEIIKENHVIIHKIIKQGSIAICIKAREKYSDWLTKLPIMIRFINNQDTIELVLTANIYRPVVTIEFIPKSIIVDKLIKTEGPIQLKFKLNGIGNVSFKPELGATGTFKVEKQSMFTEVVKKILSDLNEGIENQHKNEMSVDVSDELVDEFVDMFMHFNENKDEIYPFKGESLDEFIEVIKSIPEEKFTEMMLGYIQTFFSETLIELMNRFPSDHVEISNSLQNISVKPTVEKVTYCLRYKDALDNEYEPLEGDISVIHNTAEDDFFNIPLSIEIIPDIETDFTVLEVEK